MPAACSFHAVRIAGTSMVQSADGFSPIWRRSLIANYRVAMVVLLLASLVLLLIAFALLIAASVDHSGPTPFATSRAFVLLMAVVLGAAAAMITVALVLTNAPPRRPETVASSCRIRVPAKQLAVMSAAFRHEKPGAGRTLQPARVWPASARTVEPP